MIYYYGTEVFAVRLGPHKAHFKTKTEYTGQREAAVHDLPLLYNIEFDPSEQRDVATQNPDIIEVIRKVKEDHEASVQSVENQLEKR